MDWAKKVRSLRKRLRLKQGALADMIGVSQTYVSRLESGLMAPTPAIGDALIRLAENPRTRSVFDDFVATIRHSPFHALLIECDMDGFAIVIASPTVAPMLDGAEPRLASQPRFDAVRAHLEQLITDGLASGRLMRGIAYWTDTDDQIWQTVYAPLRDENGDWYIHITLKASTQDALREHAERYGHRPLAEPTPTSGAMTAPDDPQDRR